VAEYLAGTNMQNMLSHIAITLTKQFIKSLNPRKDEVRLSATFDSDALPLTLILGEIFLWTQNSNKLFSPSMEMLVVLLDTWGFQGHLMLVKQLLLLRVNTSTTHYF
jgi:hypothetical protein